MRLGASSRRDVTTTSRQQQRKTSMTLKLESSSFPKTANKCDELKFHEESRADSFGYIKTNELIEWPAVALNWLECDEALSNRNDLWILIYSVFTRNNLFEFSNKVEKEILGDTFKMGFESIACISGLHYIDYVPQCHTFDLLAFQHRSFIHSLVRSLLSFCI